MTRTRVVRSILEYRQLRQQWYQQNKTVGFVPTMGALHRGHLSLAQLSGKTCDVTVASIFVNPAQFAPTEDLSKYPRTEAQDVELLKETDVVFIPNVKEMYPMGIPLDVSKQLGTFVTVQGKSHQLEGAVRPHFFRGVATVLSKFFNIIQPTHAFFGQKDVQQCSVIRSMVRDLFFPIKVCIGETIREEDGLAMSSRNRYLSPEERVLAPILYQALLKGEAAYLKNPSRDFILGAIHQHLKGIKIDYISLADPFTLEEVEQVGPQGAILSGTIRVGNTRILDNLLLGMNRDGL